MPVMQRIIVGIISLGPLKKKSGGVKIAKLD
jgi:hypothetical protein